MNDVPLRPCSPKGGPRKNTRSSTAFLAVIPILAILSGCSSLLVGDWRAAPAPDDADLYINTTKFKSDGTYTAIAKRSGEDVLLAGHYEFDGFNLKLKSPGKEERVYRASYLIGHKLALTVGEKKYILKKQ